MRIALALALLALLSPSVFAEPSTRASSVVAALDLDEPTANKLLDVLTRHDAELAKLERTRVELKRQLVNFHKQLPNEADRLLIDWTANQRSLAQMQNDLIVRARALLPGPKAVHLLMLLSITEPDVAIIEPLRPTLATQPRVEVVSGRYDPDALFPPGSSHRRRCDPFASMHGCRY